MPDAVFPFPGGKSRLASWILEFVPEHRCFVEAFGGAAGVLVNKDPETSKVEVYNDRDEDLVHFFETLREHPEDLIDFLSTVPYSRTQYEQWAQAYYHGYRPKDDVARAGQFFYLRYSQWGSKYASRAGFGTSKVSSRAQSFANKRERLAEFADRFSDVVIENLHWKALVEKYDHERTVFYFDPPYVGAQEYYPTEDIDHEAFVEVLGELDACWLCSFQELPPELEGYQIVARGEKNYIGSGVGDGATDVEEHLVMNFEPEVAG